MIDAFRICRNPNCIACFSAKNNFFDETLKKPIWGKNWIVGKQCEGKGWCLLPNIKRDKYNFSETETVLSVSMWRCLFQCCYLAS